MKITQQYGDVIELREGVTVKVMRGDGDQVKFVIDAPREVSVVRQELLKDTETQPCD